MAHEKTECLRVLFLDSKNRMIGDEQLQRGTVNHSPVYPREVMKRAMELAATALIMVHNYPNVAVPVMLRQVRKPIPDGEGVEITAT